MMDYTLWYILVSLINIRFIFNIFVVINLLHLMFSVVLSFVSNMNELNSSFYTASIELIQYYRYWL